MKAIIIARVSTEEQKEANNSLPAQIHRMEEYCLRKDLQVFKKYSFDESGYHDNRADFDNILDFVLDQKEKIAVCFDKVDRLSRNVFDKRVGVLYEKALKDEVELHFVSDGQVITSHLSATEKFAFSMSLGLAKYYSDAISDNVKRAQEQMLRMGVYPASKPSRGYKRVEILKDKTEIIVDEFNSKIVQKVYELYASGAFSLDSVTKRINADFGVNWCKGFTDKVLKDKFYYGIMTWNGKEYPHKYQQIITKELYDRVQQFRAGFKKQPFKYGGKPYVYRGLLHCDTCGRAVTPEKHRGHVYYHCTQSNGKHGAGWIREEDITEQLGSVFKRMQLPQGVVDKIVENLKDNHESKSVFREEQHRKLIEEHELYIKRKEKVYMDHLDGRITDDEYGKYYNMFIAQIADIDGRLVLLENAEDNYYITAKYILELANRAYDLFKCSEIEEKRQLIKLVLSNTRLEGKKVLFEAQKPYDQILNFAERRAWLLGHDSNVQPYS